MIVNPSGLYGGGAFKVDTTTATNYFLKQKAAEQAQKDALDKYYKETMGKANSKGMRAQDIPVFGQAVQDMQDYYNQNRKAILSGNISAQQEFDQKKRTAFDIADKSIGALNNTKQVYSVIASNPDAKERIADDTFGVTDGQPQIDPATGKYKGLYAASQDVYVKDQNGKIVPNPNYEDFDVTQIQYNPKRLTLKEQQDAIDSTVQHIKPVETEPTVKPDPADKEFNIITTQKVYTPNQLTAMGDVLGNAYDDKTIKYNWKKDHPFKEAKAQSFQQFDAADKLFQSLYGRPIDNDKDYFVATNLLAKSTPQGGETQRVINPSVARQRDLQKQMQLANYQKKLSGKTLQDVNDATTGFEMIPDGTYGNAIKRGGKFYNADGSLYNSAQGQNDVNISYENIPTDIQKGLASGISPLFFKKGGLNLNIVNGVAQVGSNPLTGTISRLGLLQDRFRELGIKTEVPSQAPQKQQAVKQTQSKNTIKGKSGKTVTIPK